MSSNTPSDLGFTSWGRPRAESISSQGSSSLLEASGRRLSFSSANIAQPSQDGRQLHPHLATESKLSTSHREPIRSFINPAHRDILASVNSLQQARSVREDTAQLASYPLSDKADRSGTSLLGRNRSLSFRTTFSSDVEADDPESQPATNTSSSNWGSDAIEETSEPELVSPDGEDRQLGEESLLDRLDTELEAEEAGSDGANDDNGSGGGNGENEELEEEDEGPSLLTRALRRSPPHSLGTSSEHQPLFGTPNGGTVEAAHGRDRESISTIASDAGEEAEHEAEDHSVKLPHTQDVSLAAVAEVGVHPPTESTPLLGSSVAVSGMGGRPGYDLESQKPTVRRRLLGLLSFHHSLQAAALPTQPLHQSIRDRVSKTYRSVTHLKCWDRKRLWEHAVVAPVACLPAVIVGLLLNILDALSYGMILFPLGSPIFAHLGSAGISIFYVSTIVSQLIFSSKSIFTGGIGSELIEVVPFFHSMALTIVDLVGEEHPDAVIATTITSYALSSMVTGTVFYLMGRFKFGYIVGFIPRHILIGCIGGVGWFLVSTGFEVTARIKGSLNYDLDTLQKLLQPDTVPLWVTPLVLALVLFWAQKHIANKYFLPLYILAIPFLFYCIALVGGSGSPESLREHGWVFQGPPADEPWWFFYTLYKFDQVHWGAIAQCVPAMLALTFFGILHVPINVPALALNIGEDHADLNHELKLHGYSNFLSGCLGSIQNYLVYANTLFFMRSGGDSRLAGFELAALTFCVMLIGPKTIGFIPVMMVGCLIFDLGFELLVEAVWEPRKKLKLLEYVTVVVIVLIMGIYDFVVGIGVGILLAFASLIFQTSQISAVRAMYSGDVVNSTVRRHHSQHHYLRQVGRQICIIKVAGYLFFGTIVSVEQKIRELIKDEELIQRPIRYLILDLRQVTGLDYSAGEAFNTISRLLNGKGIHLVLSGIDADHALGHDLRAVGLGEDGIEVTFLPDTNTALELCENELLKALYASQEAQGSEAFRASVAGGANAAITIKTSSNQHLLPPAGGRSRAGSAAAALDLLASSPRHHHLQAAAQEALSRMEGRHQPKWQNFSEPLRLILQVFEEISDKNEDFWFRATRYFVRREFAPGEMLFASGMPADGFYLLEKGIVRAEYDVAYGQFYHESIVAGTTCGELPFFSDTPRTATAYADLDCVAWVLTHEAWERLQKDDPEVASELLRVSLKLTAERMATVPSSTMLMAD